MTWGPILNVLWIALSHSTLWLQLPLVWSFKSFSFHVFRPVKTSSNPMFRWLKTKIWLAKSPFCSTKIVFSCNQKSSVGLLTSTIIHPFSPERNAHFFQRNPSPQHPVAAPQSAPASAWSFALCRRFHLDSNMVPFFAWESRDSSIQVGRCP